MIGLIGADEAGYGPNLGPLTITGCLWENRSGQENLYDALADVIKNAPDRSRDSRLVVADSKRVYKSNGSIRNLETTVLSLLLASQQLGGTEPSPIPLAVPRSVRDLMELVCPQAKLPTIGYACDQIQLPLQSDTNAILDSSRAAADVMVRNGVTLARTICLPVFPEEFNHGLQNFGNKAELLSNRSINLVNQLKSKFSAAGDLEIVCDKHGGRSRYAGLIQEHLTSQPISIGCETREASDYFFSENDRDIAVRFQAGGESFLPTAFASMVCKYVREVFMEAWNQFWISRIPTLKPTKGYPQDAKRFKREIENHQRELGIRDFDIWRQR